MPTSPASVKFGGFPAAAYDFYAGLRADNSKAYWLAHRPVYEEAVRLPMQALLDELAPEFGAAKVFRPNRDVRFSNDKSPYKDHQGGFVGAEDGVGWYVQLSADGLMVAGGWYSPQGQQVARYREAVESLAGLELDRLVAAAETAGLTVGGDVMATRPRGVDPEHPRLRWLRHRSLTCSREYGTPAWVSTRRALSRVRTDWQATAPLVEWLADHVGPVEEDGPGR